MKIDEQKCRDNAQKFDGYFHGLISAGLTPCISVLCSRNGKITYAFHGGSERPCGEGRKLTAATRLNIASVTKTTTAAMILKLVEQGRVSLTDRVVTFIPEYPFDDVTVFNLMTHTAGYDEMHIVPWPTSPDGLRAFYKEIYGIKERKYKTGETAAYWTFHYAILADILQRVSGQCLEAFAQEYLFRPLDMGHSTFELKKLTDEQLILPWYERENRAFPEACVPVATGDSGLYTTAEDLLHFAQMILDRGEFGGKRIFSRAAMELMLRESTGGKFSKSPGLWIKGGVDTFGCFGDLSSPAAAGHTGMTGCMLLVDPGYDMAAVILTNSLKLHENWNNYKKICDVLTVMQTDDDREVSICR